MSAPSIPPRPQRAQLGPTAVPQNIPNIPPRPDRKTDPSPAREMARSPLNELPSSLSNGHAFYGQANLSASDLPRRPPSVQSLPMVGQEGNEYASFDQLPPEAHGVKDAALQTRHADVPMLAPTASVPVSTAKSRISAVTRTDSSQAAAVGVGKPRSEDTEGESLHRTTSREQYAPSLRAKASFNRSSQNLQSTGSQRPPSIHGQVDFEQGIPSIGMQVPMYPNAGDVQAPSPGPGQTLFPAGIGFFNDGSQRAHSRRRSSRQEFGPPGSYGLHGHPGQEPGDQFERQWIAKHPDVAAREGYNVYGGLTPRPASALTSDQLNRLVREGDDIGFGTDRKAIGTPDQEIGYLASEMYAAHLSSAKPSPTAEGRTKRPSSGTQAVPDSPLQKASFPFSQSGADAAVEDEDDAVIHVDPPERRRSKITGGGEADGTMDFGSRAGNTSDAGGWFDERGPGIPILASDEIMKRPGSAYLQPAVSPELSRDDDDAPHSRRGSAQPGSRPSSRPTSTHGHHAFGSGLSRFISQEEHHGSGGGTPLEEIEEYEPLFPEDDKNASKILLKEKLKQRPSLAAHQFPSQDVWEDTPASLQFTADVETPEPERQSRSAAAVFETPEQEQARRTQNPDDMTSDAKTFAKPHFRGAQHEHERPGVHRFPSRDVWEDTADSARLETTVTSPQSEMSQPEERPTTSAIPLQQDDSDARASTGLTQLMKSGVSSRPHSRSKLSQDITADVAPSEEDSRGKDVPDLGAKAKPVVPARPARFTQAEPTDDSASSPPKAKPAVPARPAGNKLAGLRANFMNDLNSRLQLGPQAPSQRQTETEAEPAPEEKAPLADARKGRAKGPARRKPASAPAAESFGFSFSSMTLWHIDEEDELKVHPGINDGPKETSQQEEPSAQPVEAESGYTREAVGHDGDMPDPTISPAVVKDANAVKSELEQALASAEMAPSSAEELQASLAVSQGNTPVAAGKTVHDAGSLDVRAPEDGNVAVRDGEEVGRTD